MPVTLGSISTYTFTTPEGLMVDVSNTPPSPVPLPASAWLMLSGVVGLGATARRRRAA
jgi:hypothetical protein